jgi:hypothetical protein
MKILYQNTKVLGTATDAYEGPDSWIMAPEGFDVSRLDEYTMVNGFPTLPSLSSANKAKAVELLQATDWSELPSVTNTSLTPHLINADEFANYRVIIRGIAVNPPDTAVTWPAVPNANWSA